MPAINPPDQRRFVATDAPDSAVSQDLRERAGVLGFAAGDVVAIHAHSESEDLFLILSGSCTFCRDDVQVEVQAGDMVRVPTGCLHSFRPQEPPVVLAIAAPNLQDHVLAEVQE